MSRDLSTRLFKAGRLSLIFEPRDVWVGVYAAPDAVYICLIPRLPIRWARTPGRVTFTFPHGTTVAVDRRGNLADEETNDGH